LGIEPYFHRPGYCEFRIGDYQHELGLIDSKYAPFDTQASNPAGTVMYWHVDDVHATFDRLLSMGATQLEAPRDRGQGFITASVVDPFGQHPGHHVQPALPGSSGLGQESMRSTKTHRRVICLTCSRFWHESRR